MNDYKLVEDIKDFYHKQLKKYMKKNKIKLFEKYGITNELVDKYLLGISFVDDNLEKYLLKKGYSKKELLNIPMFRSFESKILDIANGMIMIPVNDRKGICSGFLGIKESDDKEILTSTYECIESNCIFGLESWNSSSEDVYLCDNPLVALKLNDSTSRVKYCSLKEKTISIKEIFTLEELNPKRILVPVSNFHLEDNYLCEINTILRLIEYKFNVMVMQKGKEY